MPADYDDAIAELERMRDRVRTIRTLSRKPKSNGNPRYVAFSNVVSNLTKAIDDLQPEARGRE